MSAIQPACRPASNRCTRRQLGTCLFELFSHSSVFFHSGQAPPLEPLICGLFAFSFIAPNATVITRLLLVVAGASCNENGGKNNYTHTHTHNFKQHLSSCQLSPLAQACQWATTAPNKKLVFVVI